jgi:hypothetical protein
MYYFQGLLLRHLNHLRLRSRHGSAKKGQEVMADEYAGKDGASLRTSKPGLSIHRILAVLPVSDLGVAEAWYTRLFDRPADAAPMFNLREWHVGSAGLQVIEIPTLGGPAFVTLLVNSLEDQRLALADRGLRLGASQPGDQGGIAQIVDPSGNTLTFAQRRAEREGAPRANEKIVRA